MQLFTMLPGMCLFIEWSSLSFIPSWLSDNSSSYFELLSNFPEMVIIVYKGENVSLKILILLIMFVSDVSVSKSGTAVTPTAAW